MPSDLYANDRAGAANRADDEDEEAPFAFELESASRRGRVQWLRRFVARVAPVLLLTGLLLAVAEQPYLARLFHRPVAAELVPITVVCDVPWAIIHVDGRGAAIPCASGVGGALPMARFSVAGGIHTLMATADGFAPYPIYIVAHPGASGLYLTQFALTREGGAQILAAVNNFFASGYAQDVRFPAALWQTFGLRTPPTSASLLVREGFEAVALDAYEPTYSETTYQRPVAPEQGAVGIAVVVVEHVTIYDGCGTTPLLDRRAPVLYATRASVTFSARLESQGWLVSKPYALNPLAEIDTPPDRAASPASPAGLLALAAHTELANRVGGVSTLFAAVTITPVVSASEWAAGVEMTPPSAMRASTGAVWLYMGARLIALTSAAQALSPSAPAVSLLSLDELRASLANQPARVC